VFTVHPANSSPIAGMDVTFHVSVTGSPEPTIQWQVRTSGGVWTNIGIEDVALFSLTVGNVSGSMHDNQYRAVATNSEGTATSNSATMLVRVPPAFTVHPSDRTVNVGQNIVLSASVSGTAQIVVWEVSTDGGNTWSSVSATTSTTLSLTSITAAMDGNMYRVRVTGAGITIYSNPATLTVNPPASG
jgi:hypothetical protein